MSPKTSNGQLFCIFFAIIGIPMFAAVLVGTGERLQIPIKWLHRGRPWVKDNQSRDEQVKSIVFMSVGKTSSFLLAKLLAASTVRCNISYFLCSFLTFHLAIGLEYLDNEIHNICGSKHDMIPTRLCVALLIILTYCSKDV